MENTSEYKKLLKHILDNGYKKEDRTGVGTISTFGYQCRFNLQEGFPIVTEKKTAFKTAITELIWMIGGWINDVEYRSLKRTNIKFLLNNKCYIWTEWPYKAYLNKIQNYINKNINIPEKECNIIMGKQVPFSQKEFETMIMNYSFFAEKYGDLGPVYQKQWRDFEGKKQTVDQLLTMIKRLDSNPDCRRNLSSYWNPTELNDMLLPPCHLLHQVWTRELTFEERKNLIPELIPNIFCDKDLDVINIPKRAISLQMYQRSSDSFLGVPFDWVWYAAFTHILAELTNMVVGDFIWVSGDTHLYLNSIEETNEVLNRETFKFPKLNIKRKVDKIEDYKIEDFELIDYKYGEQLKVQVAV